MLIEVGSHPELIPIKGKIYPNNDCIMRYKYEKVGVKMNRVIIRGKSLNYLFTLISMFNDNLGTN